MTKIYKLKICLKSMFTLDLLNLLNQYKTAEEYEKNNIESNIKNLIKQNKNEFLDFAKQKANSLDANIQNFLQKCYDEVEEDENQEENKQTTPKETTSDFQIIKQAYEKWLEEFLLNQNSPNEKCEKIVEEIIFHYAKKDLETLKKLLEIDNDENFENFKNMINNYLGRYYAEKIEQYYQSEEFKHLGFFKKREQKKKILNLLDQIGKYKFEKEKIDEVLK